MGDRLSLRERLLLLVLAAILPLAGLLVWVSVREMQDDIADAKSQLTFAASLIAAHQDRNVADARNLLATIGAMPQMRRPEPVTCNKFFETLHDLHPVYSNFGIVDIQGKGLCHANFRGGDFSLADRSYFAKALAERRFVMGAPAYGKVSGRFIVPFARPIFDGDKVTAIAFAALDLEQAGGALAGAQLPAGARVVVTDRRGLVLMEHPPRTGGVSGTTPAEPSLLDAARQMAAGTGEWNDASGEPRIHAFAPSHLVFDEGFLAAVSIDKGQVARAVFTNLRAQLLALLLALAVGLAAAWWLGGRVIVLPAKQILATVRRLEHGNLDARVPLQAGMRRGEFARIGSAFNLMAESLQLRQLDLQTELGRSRSAYTVLDLVLNSMQDALVAVTSTGQFLLFNEAATRLFPLNGPALLPQQWAEGFGFYRDDKTTLYRTEELPLVRSTRGESGRLQQLFVRNTLVPEGRMLQCSWQPIRSESGVSGGLVVFTDVTELQRLQSEQAAQFEQLREVQRKLVETQRIGRVGNWELGMRDGRLWWSEEVYELLGVAPGKFDGTLEAFINCVHPDDRPLLKAARESALREGRPVNVEFRVLKPDGVAWMHEIAEARSDVHGEPVWYGGVVQDITARKRDEQALLDSERQLHDYTLMLQRAAEAAHAITAHPSPENTMQEVADQACRVIGCHQAMVSLAESKDWSRMVTSVSLSGKYAPWRDHGPAPLAAYIEAMMRESRAALRLTQAQLEADPGWLAVVGGDGDAHAPPSGLLAMPLVSRNGQNIGLLVLLDKEQGEFTERDEYVAMELAQLGSIAIENASLFTEIRELNAGLEARITERTAELTRQELLFRTLAEQAPEVIWKTEGPGRATYLNRAWYELIGGTPADWLESGWMTRLHPDDVAEVQRLWQNARQTLQPYGGIRRFLAKDGSYHSMSFKAAPVLDELGQVAFWVGIDTDITELKAIERALRSSNQELEAFSYSVSHDLRAPLGAIGGFSRALSLKLEGHPDERVKHYLARIQAAVGKMEELIEDLLSLARVARAPLNYGPVDLGAMARDTLEALQSSEPQRKVSLQVQEELVAQGDARLLRVVMENLLGNAWKFTSKREEGRIEVSRIDDSSVFAVRDNGVGFDMAYANKLFGAFQRLHTEAEFPGTGIGLATVRRIVTRHQGRVWAESRVGEGTTFFFTLSESAPPPWLAGEDPATW
ncbi:MAG TPA: PAS domain-containing protein [Ramlibacter sp.]|nr:PAS domain-containing protein [Ramlibacter sp.]